MHRKLRLGFMVEALTFDESIGIAASAVVQRAVYPSGRFATAARNLVSHNVWFLGAKIVIIPVVSKESVLLRQILSLLCVDLLRVTMYSRAGLLFLTKTKKNPHAVCEQKHRTFGPKKHSLPFPLEH